MKKWEPESNAHIARRVGKTGEESCELGSVCARISIQGLQSVDPSSGKTNRQRLIEEMADVQAQINCNIGTILTDDEHRWFQQRTIEKMAQMSQWEAHYKPMAAQDSNPQAQMVDPMDTPLPCDVTVGHGTHKKGVPLRSLVLRMEVLYKMVHDQAIARRDPAQVDLMKIINDMAQSGRKPCYACQGAGSTYVPSGATQIRYHCNLCGGTGTEPSDPWARAVAVPPSEQKHAK